VSDHPTDAELYGLVRGELAPAKAKEVAHHLLGRCAPCSRVIQDDLAAMAGGAERERVPPARDSDYELAIDRASAGLALHGPRVLAKKKAARRMHRALAAGGLARARQERGFKACFAVFEALLARAWEVRFDDRPTMINLTQWACVVAPRLGVDGYGKAQVSDFEARAWGEHANALRAAFQLTAAEDALRRAVAHWELGTRDRSLAVRLLDIGASLLGNQRRLDEAIGRLQEVHAAYLNLGDLSSAGKALVNQATYIGHEGDPQRAARLLDEALRLLDPVLDQDAMSIAIHSKIWFLADAGRFREARAALWQHRQWMAAFRDLGRIYAAKLAHVEGYINAGLGELDRAERALEEARDLFARDDERWLVSLDLAAVWMRQGRLAEARELAAESAEQLLALGVPSEAEKALRVLCDASRRQVVTAVLVQSVIDFLRRVEHSPEARFEARSD
jgi:tetratricopeptide (TPR) repeat protein